MHRNERELLRHLIKLWREEADRLYKRAADREAEAFKFCAGELATAIHEREEG
jgi:hypothetical protein